MKKLLAVLISVLLIFSLCGCLGNNDTPQSEVPVISGPTSETPTPDNDNKNETQNEQKAEQPSPEKQNGSQNGTPDNEKNDDTPPKQQNQNTNLNDKESPEAEIIIPDVNDIVTDHKPLSKESYYQRSFLSNTEKSLYDEFCLAAEKCQSTINVKKYNFKESVVKKIYSAFCADCPQYFYISKRSTFVVDSETKCVTEFVIHYTDGQTIDDFDDDGNPTVTADREKIKNQITEFSNKISAILSFIPSDISELERERKIYDYIAKTVIYDHEAENNSRRNSDELSYSFSAYGAACKGKAVCEGYVKLFQFLCYNSGINVTSVESDNDMQHMWAAAKIDDNWYMCDITWDDADNHLGCLYYYFNVTTDFIKKDHSFGNNLKIPNCDSLSASFYNNFAIVPNGNILPADYKNLIYSALTNGEEYLYVYRGTNSENLEEFINNNFYDAQCDAYKYLNKLGYTLGSSYYHTDTYYFLPLIKKQSISRCSIFLVIVSIRII